METESDAGQYEANWHHDSWEEYDGESHLGLEDTVILSGCTTTDNVVELAAEEGTDNVADGRCNVEKPLSTF